MNQRGVGLLGLLIVVAIIGLLAYGSYSFWNNDKKIDIKDGQQVENNMKEINQNPVQLHEIKVNAQQDIEMINRRIASSTDNYLE